MATPLRIEPQGRFRENGLWIKTLEVKIPLVDGKMIDAGLTVSREPAKPQEVMLRLREVVFIVANLEERDGALKTEHDTELGRFSELCPLSHAASLMGALLQELGIQINEFTLEAAKRINALAVDETMQPRRTWIVSPDMDANGTNGLGKYLLMKREGTEEHILGWDSSMEPQHREIWERHDKTENLGGGFIYVLPGMFRLTDESTTYHQPPLELVYDAALGLIKLLRPHMQIREARLEGAERFVIPVT